MSKSSSDPKKTANIQLKCETNAEKLQLATCNAQSVIRDGRDKGKTLCQKYCTYIEKLVMIIVLYSILSSRSVAWKATAILIH